MDGNPAQFEAIGNRLGFRVAEESSERLSLVWQGPRYPAFLCLGIALALLFVSVPIVLAIHLRGFVGPAGSLWYFPLMNLVLFAISLVLLSQKRIIVFDNRAQRVTLSKRILHCTTVLSVAYAEVEKLKLGIDQVYSGFAVAGSSAAEKFPVPALRLIAGNGDSVLLDRGSKRKLEALANRISRHFGKLLEIEPPLQN